MSRVGGLSYTLIVLAQAVYAKAMDTILQRAIEFKSVVLKMDGLHAASASLRHYQKAARLDSAGLTDVPIESQTAESTVTTPVIAGRQYNRSVRSHKTVGEALECFRQSTFLSYESTDIAASDFARLDKVVLELPSFSTKDNLLQADSSCLIFNRYEAF